jgi:hypothetical protein
MPGNLQGFLVFCQQARLVITLITLKVMQKQDHGFIARLNEIADQLGIAPGHGRVTEFGRMFGAKQQTADLWFQGRTKPNPATLKRIVAKARVRSDWLRFGIGEKDMEPAALRPALQGLLKTAEPLPDYKVELAKKFLLTLADSQIDAGNGNGEGPPTKKKSAR